MYITIFYTSKNPFHNNRISTQNRAFYLYEIHKHISSSEKEENFLESREEHFQSRFSLVSKLHYPHNRIWINFHSAHLHFFPPFSLFLNFSYNYFFYPTITNPNIQKIFWTHFIYTSATSYQRSIHISRKISTSYTLSNDLVSHTFHLPNIKKTIFPANNNTYHPSHHLQYRSRPSSKNKIMKGMDFPIIHEEIPITNSKFSYYNRIINHFHT